MSQKIETVIAGKDIGLTQVGIDFWSYDWQIKYTLARKATFRARKLKTFRQSESFESHTLYYIKFQWMAKEWITH